MAWWLPSQQWAGPATDCVCGNVVVSCVGVCDDGIARWPPWRSLPSLPWQTTPSPQTQSVTRPACGSHVGRCGTSHCSVMASSWQALSSPMHKGSHCQGPLKVHFMTAPFQETFITELTIGVQGSSDEGICLSNAGIVYRTVRGWKWRKFVNTL